MTSFGTTAAICKEHARNSYTVRGEYQRPDKPYCLILVRGFEHALGAMVYGSIFRFVGRHMWSDQSRVYRPLGHAARHTPSMEASVAHQTSPIMPHMVATIHFVTRNYGSLLFPFFSHDLPFQRGNPAMSAHHIGTRLWRIIILK